MHTKQLSHTLRFENEKPGSLIFPESHPGKPKVKT